MSIGFLIAYSLKVALNTFALGNFISFFSTTFFMSLLALNSTCSSSDPSMLIRSSSKAGSAHSGSTWGALLDSRAVLGAEPYRAEFWAHGYGTEFWAANMSSPKSSPFRHSFSQLSSSSSPFTFCSSTLALTSTSCSSSLAPFSTSSSSFSSSSS